MKNVENSPENNKIGKKYVISGKIYLIFGLIALFLIIYLFIGFQKTQKLSLYNYKNFYWTNSSDSLIYTRSSISSNKLSDFFAINCSSEKIRHLSQFNNKSNAPLGFSTDSSVFYSLNQDSMGPYVSGIDFFNISPVKEHKLPFPKPQNIVYCRNNVIISQEIDDMLTIGSLSLTDGNYIKLFERQSDELNTYKMIDSAISFDEKYFAFAIWHRSSDNIEGFTEVLLYSYKDDSLHKTTLFSYGNDLSLKVSHDTNMLAIKTVALDDSGKRIPSIHYLNFDDLKVTDCTLADKLPYDFELIWIDGGKNLIKTDKNLYIIKPERDNVLTAKPIFDKTSLAFDIDDFIPSPSGKRMILVRYAIGNNLKSDVWISNIDGTSNRRLIKPEGRRKLERLYLYRYLRNCKKVIHDLVSIFSK